MVRQIKALSSVLLLLSFLAPVTAEADDFPTRPIEFVVGFSAGGVTDVAARLFAEHASKKLGQILVVNKAGAGGVIAASSVKNAAPDGYTILFAHSGTHAVLKAIQELPYDPQKDFTPITTLMSWQQFLVVPANLPVNSIDGLRALAKSKPGGLSYASQGVGSGGHLLGALLETAFGTKMVHIPYKGGGDTVVDLINGRVDMAFTINTEILSQVDAGKLKILAVTSDARLPTYPDIPTMSESGFPSVSDRTWFGLAAPAGTPQPIIAKIRDAFIDATRDPEIVKSLAKRNIIVENSTPEELAMLIANEIAKWESAAKAAGIKK